MFQITNQKKYLLDMAFPDQNVDPDQDVTVRFGFDVSDIDI